MINLIKSIYEVSPALMYVLLFMLFLLFRNISHLIRFFRKGEQVISTEGRFFEYITTRTPWYFTVLFLLLIINGLLAVLTKNETFYESFKYISGSMVGALIGLAEHYRAEKTGQPQKRKR